MEALSWVLFGFAVALVSRTMMPGRESLGMLVSTGLGIAGALLGGWAGRLLALYGSGRNVGVLGSVFGAMMILTVGNAIKRHLYSKKRALSPEVSEEKVDRVA